MKSSYSPSKLLSAALTISLLGFGSANAQSSKDSGHVYLLIGQSNMAGRAAYSEKEAEPLERCYLLNDKDEWEPASNPLNRYSTIRKGLNMQKMNPGYSFAQAMLRARPNTTVGLIVNAKGGSKIEQWKKGTRFYEEAVRRTRIAQKKGTLKGVLWHQGESDHNHPDGYAEKLATLVKNLREDLGAPDLPFVAGQINNVPRINEEITKLPELVDHAAFISSEGLSTKDRWHFDAESVKEMGKRYAAAILKLQN